MTADNAPIRILIADDHPIFREGLRRLLETEPRFIVVAEASNGVEAIELSRTLEPDILLLDLLMERMDGLGVLRALRAESGKTRIVLLTAAIDRTAMLAAVQLGVRGILTKATATPLLYKCIDRVVAGEYWLGREGISDIITALQQPQPTPVAARAPMLTPRERDIVQAVVNGASNKDIAAQFGVTPQTIKNHLSATYDKLGVSSRLELALYALHHRLFRDEE